MICEQCGHENESSSKFCIECGTALRPTGNDASIKEMRETQTEKESDTRDEATFDIVAVKRQRRNFRLSGVGVGFALGFILSASSGIGVGIFVGVFCALIGYVIAELSRHFVRNQRLLPKMEGSTIMSETNHAEPEAHTVKQAEKPGAWILLFVLIVVGYQVIKYSTNQKTQGTIAIENAYASFVVNGRGDNLECISKEIQTHEFVLCTFTFGEGIWPHKGLWMVDNGKYLALNGKALTARKRLRSEGNFQEVPPRMKVNVGGIMNAFDTGVVSGNGDLVSVVSEKSVSQQHMDAYCSYMREKDQLINRAYELFGEDPVNEKRSKWIDPKVIELRNKHFALQNMDYFDVAGNVTSAGIRCPR